jgi:hypothetical protein
MLPSAVASAIRQQDIVGRGMPARVGSQPACAGTGIWHLAGHGVRGFAPKSNPLGSLSPRWASHSKSSPNDPAAEFEGP